MDGFFQSGIHKKGYRNKSNKESSKDAGCENWREVLQKMKLCSDLDPQNLEF